MKFFSFAGRSTRTEWWGLNAFGMVVLNALMFSEVSSRGDIGPRTCLVALLLYLVISLPVTYRRLHDVNQGGGLSVAFLMTNWLLPVSIILGIYHNYISIIYVLPIIIISIISGVWQLILLGCKDGTMGPNDYGEDPKKREGMPSGQAIIVNVANGTDAEQRLMQLKKLKDQGMISDVEYEDKRSKILGEI